MLFRQATNRIWCNCILDANQEYALPTVQTDWGSLRQADGYHDIDDDIDDEQRRWSGRILPRTHNPPVIGLARHSAAAPWTVTDLKTEPVGAPPF